ncbi:MAG: hypothetical protein V1810_01765 [Candidatus Beckwithbacteria bacterium]
MLEFIKPKFLLKVVWAGFAAFGVFMLFKQYLPDFLPNLINSSLIKGVQSGLVESQTPDYPSTSPDQPLDLKTLTKLDPQQASLVISEVIRTEITKILETTTEEIKSFPAKQVKKIKIGACEDLLEADICSVAKELQCQ